jgi:hypothetical protein
MSKDAGSIEAVPGNYFRGPLERACSVCSTTLNMLNMANRKIYIVKPQIIDEQQLFHNNNLTFNTLTSKF